jgi:hypothetical protein
MVDPNERPKNDIQRHIFLLFDEPLSSTPAWCLAVVIILLIIVSIIAFVLETSVWAEIYIPLRVWIVVEFVCSVVFSVEFAFRLYATPAGDKKMGRCSFLMQPLNITDVLAILPFYVEYGLWYYDVEPDEKLGFLRLVRVTRVLRLFKLSRYSTWLQLVAEGMRRSAKPVAILLSMFMIMALIFASTLFFVEKSSDPDEPSPFYNIPISLYWAVTTMTTVGYGDMYPQTFIGKLIAVCTMFCGILLLALPVIVVGGNFQEVYNEAEQKKRGGATAKENEGKKILEDWDKRVRDLQCLIDRTEHTCEASNSKARDCLHALKYFARSPPDGTLAAKVKPM